MQTQWRIVSYGMGGARYTGIDYATLPAMFGLYGIKKKQQIDTFEAIRVMELAALTEINARNG